MTRDFLDEILASINSETLTDAEYNSINLPGANAYTKAVYEALRTILNARESVSEQTLRLKYFFLARGVDVSGMPNHEAKTHILIGVAL